MIAVFAINLPNRIERRKSILKEFAGKGDFNLKILDPIENEKPAYSLWLSLQHIIRHEVNFDDDFFILCEDDHQFTENYSYDFLIRCLKKAISFNADILSGGVSWQRTSVQVDPNLFWVERFSGTQFIIISKKIYKKILEITDFSGRDTLDFKLCGITDRKFVIYPAISVQKEFGYSDVTRTNNTIGRVKFLFDKTNHIFNSLNEIRHYYQSAVGILKMPLIDYNKVYLPLYIISLKKKNEVQKYFQHQFSKKDEFKKVMIEPKLYKTENETLWKSVVTAVELAIKNKDDFMILCKDDHQFTQFYNRENFIKCIVQSYMQKTDILLGGIGGFESAVPIDVNRLWIDWFWHANLIVIYKTLYQKILFYRFVENDTIERIMSSLSANKMVLYPFISKMANANSLSVDENYKQGTSLHFIVSENRLKRYLTIYKAYLCQEMQ